MQTPREHLNQAISNEKFLNEIDQGRFPDWTVTVAFYTALHLIGQVLARDGIDPDSHQIRNDYIWEFYPSLWKLYNPLYTWSKDARYVCGHSTVKDAENALRQLDRIEAEVNRILTAP